MWENPIVRDVDSQANEVPRSEDWNSPDEEAILVRETELIIEKLNVWWKPIFTWTTIVIVINSFHIWIVNSIVNSIYTCVCIGIVTDEDCSPFSSLLSIRGVCVCVWICLSVSPFVSNPFEVDCCSILLCFKCSLLYWLLCCILYIIKFECWFCKNLILSLN